MKLADGLTDRYGTLLAKIFACSVSTFV